jgi:hypothetical protein
MSAFTVKARDVTEVSSFIISDGRLAFRNFLRADRSGGPHTPTTLYGQARPFPVLRYRQSE